jgi:hypothetical protein
MSFPLQDAKLCINCDFVYAGGGSVCIKCGSEQWVWLSRYLKSLTEDNHEKVGNDCFCCNANGGNRI